MIAIVSGRASTREEAAAVKLSLECLKSGRPEVLNAYFSSAAAPAPTFPAGNGADKRLFGLSQCKRLLGGSYAPLRAAWFGMQVARSRRRAHAVFSCRRPALVIIFDDRRIVPDFVALVVAHELNIPVLQIKAAESSMEADLLMRQEALDHLIKPTSGIVRTFPSQVMHGPDGSLYSFYPRAETRVLHWMNLLPQVPWTCGASGADMICVSSQAQYEYVALGGTSKERIRITGQPSLDALSQVRLQKAGLREVLIKRYGICASRPLVICAVPQHGEQGLTDWANHWQLTHELFSALSAAPVTVLLSLHPTSDRAEYAAHAAKWGLSVLDERLADVLPAADVFVAFFSSTVAWAIGLAIPVLIIDSIASNYALFRQVPGVQVVDTHMSLAEALRRLATDPAFAAAARADAARGQSSVGAIDGRSATRVGRAVEELLNAWNAGT